MAKHFNTSDIRRDACQLVRKQAQKGYDWWWHSFTGHHAETGEEKVFFVEFFLCNPASGGEQPIFGQLKENQEKGIAPSYMMIKAGCWGENKVQLHRFFGWNDVKVDMGVPFSIRAQDCYLDEKQMVAKVEVSEEDAKAHPEWMSDFGKMDIDLKINKLVAFNVGFGAGAIFRRFQLFDMFWHAEGMKSLFKGTITLNDEKYIIDPVTCNGYADKNWGKDFTSPWLWLSSNNLTSELSGKKLKDSVFDIGGGTPKMGKKVFHRQLLGAFWYENTPYEFNFSKNSGCKTQFNVEENEEQIIWHVEQKANGIKMVTDITCEKKDMLLVNYEAPDGKKRHNRLWNGGTGTGTISLYHGRKLIDRIKVENAGCEYGEYDQ